MGDILPDQSWRMQNIQNQIRCGMMAYGCLGMDAPAFLKNLEVDKNDESDIAGSAQI